MAWGPFNTGGGGGGADTPTAAANVTYDNSTSKLDADNVQEALDFANMAAQYGDYNYLKDLGIDTSALAALNAAGGYSGGGSSSGSSSGGTSTGSTGSSSDSEYDPSQGYETIANMARSMKTARATDAQIMSYINQRYDDGDLTRNEVIQIMQDLNLGGYNDM